MSANRTIRAAQPGDGEQIVGFVRALARYERMEDQVRASAADFERALFGAPPTAEALLVFEGEQALGFALYYPAMSTFDGCPRLYLEDLYVAPEARGRGHGRALLARLAGIAVARGWRRMEWSVLDWNEAAIAFYEGLDAELDRQWLRTVLADEALRKLADAGEPQA
jgi:ribosomal protein S18 acetylase RimI-like enzyme